MKPKSVIVDVAIDQGGVFATSDLTTHSKPTFAKSDVVHYCVPNITSRISRTASYALSNIFTPLITELAFYKDFESYIKMNQGARLGTYSFNGNLTNKVLGEKFKLRFKDIDLLLGSLLD
jgi:alanine dehydrogenase